MQQQPQHMLPVRPSFPSNNITTTEIQKYLDENKKLILAILDNQNLGKLAECAQFQAQLQKNLMFLAAIADAQPQTPAIPPQMAPHPAMQQGGYYMPHPQAVAMPQQQGLFPSKMPTQYTPHQMQEQHQQQLQQQRHQQAAIQGQMGMRPFGADTTGGGNRHDGSEAGGADGQGGSATNHGASGNGESSDA